LLSQGYWVSVVDALFFGGESLVGWLPMPRFHFVRGDVTRPGTVEEAGRQARERGAPPVEAVVHLAAIAGEPAAKVAGRETVWRQNVDAVPLVFGAAEALDAMRFVLASTSSVYGITPSGVQVAEDGPLNPLSLYAESKLAAERALEGAARGSSVSPLVFRFATAFGISPRMRFDLLLNQLVRQAFEERRLEIFSGDHYRTFVHVRDLADGILAGLSSPDRLTRGQVFNLGSEAGTCTKDQLADRIREALPETEVRRSDHPAGGDERDLQLSFDKAWEVLRFRPKVSLAEGIAEIVGLLRSGLIRDTRSDRYRNANPVAA
jgi:nucleoside-diphosphate-sugar epimerase